ncbi:hypothetical protein S1361_15880 [Streptomyces cyanogenus]|uniref:DUF397 domain-containing protein n=2 Tax=Streptomyces cyanogenus TaxID=80860 RepID=A0ABX7TT78_STRCY|nr:hypothetical protein S1361_15880 [Streptomyces cyanogenus]
MREASAGHSCELAWFKSSYSGGTNGESCVEVAVTLRKVHVRDSKSLGGPQLAVASDTWADFVSYASRS